MGKLLLKAIYLSLQVKCTSSFHIYKLLEPTWIKQDIATLRVFLGISFELVCNIRVIILSNGQKDHSSYRSKHFIFKINISVLINHLHKAQTSPKQKQKHQTSKYLILAKFRN